MSSSAALLGADEFGFSTAPLIAMGCIMMRVCHLNTCPVGIATQDPELRRRFRGTPEHVSGYLMFVAEEVRGIMASLGVRRFEDLIGRTDLLAPTTRSTTGRRAMLTSRWCSRRPSSRPARRARRTRPQVPVLDDALDWELVAGAASRRSSDGEPVRSGRSRVRNVNRTVGGILSGEIARRYGARGLPEGTIEISFSGLGGPELRRLARARGDVLAARRDQRLHRQGPVGRRSSRSARRDGAVPAPRRT